MSRKEKAKKSKKKTIFPVPFSYHRMMTTIIRPMNTSVLPAVMVQVFAPTTTTTTKLENFSASGSPNVIFYISMAFLHRSVVSMQSKYIIMTTLRVLIIIISLTKNHPEWEIEKQFCFPFFLNPTKHQIVKQILNDICFRANNKRSNAQTTISICTFYVSNVL